MADRESRGASGILIRDLNADFDPRLLSAFYSDVLEPSFAPAELVTLRSLEDALTSPGEDETLVVVAVSDVEAVVGGMVGEWYPDSQVLLLAYLAVRAEVRGRGIGTILLGHADAHWYAEREPAVALAEVAHPDFFPVSQHGDPAARLRLYERAGALALDMPYFQPEINPGAGRVYDMMLIAFSWRPVVQTITRTGPGIDGNVVATFLDEYFTVCEGAEVVATDAEYRALRAHTERPDGVRLLPLTRYQEIPVLDRTGRAVLGNRSPVS
jgi:GNAT superfamily N-acetyltransferase